MRPRAIASSGEISRVMLALKSVLANQDKIPVLVLMKLIQILVVRLVEL